METLGDRIKQVRKHHRLTQVQFAERIGSVQNTVTGYENGRRSPSTPVIELICREFGINRQWLETGEGEMLIAADDTLLEEIARKYGLDAEDMVAIKSFLELKPEHRRGVIEWGKKFAAKMAAQMGIDFPIQEEVRKPDSEKTPDEIADMVREQVIAQREAAKRGISTSSASTTTNSSLKKFGNSS